MHRCTLCNSSHGFRPLLEPMRLIFAILCTVCSPCLYQRLSLHGKGGLYVPTPVMDKNVDEHKAKGDSSGAPRRRSFQTGVNLLVNASKANCMVTAAAPGRQSIQGETPTLPSQAVGPWASGFTSPSHNEITRNVGKMTTASSSDVWSEDYGEHST